MNEKKINFVVYSLIAVIVLCIVLNGVTNFTNKLTDNQRFKDIRHNEVRLRQEIKEGRVGAKAEMIELMKDKMVAIREGGFAEKQIKQIDDECLMWIEKCKE